jgi:hypothetical protein
MKKCNALTHSINDNWANIFYSYTNTSISELSSEKWKTSFIYYSDTAIVQQKIPSMSPAELVSSAGEQEKWNTARPPRQAS